MNGFFEDSNGNKSNSRLIADVCIVVALIFAGVLVSVGYNSNETTIQIATSAGLIFTTIAGPAMLFLFAQKKTEEENKQDDTKV